MKYILLFVLFFSFSCKKKPISSSQVIVTTKKLTPKNGNTIKTRFSVPKGYLRVKTKENSFEEYLQNFKLKSVNSKVRLFNNKLKSNQNFHAAILDITVGNKDLQQCADATMRLRSEYLFEQKRYNDIHFNFTNGFNVAYSKWRKGYRLNVKGNKVSWYKTNKESKSYQSFTKYMQWIFMYAGTLSLSKEMITIPISKMEIGAVFIQGGSPGHAVIVVDMATNGKNETLFMIAQSYMPAQDIHILKNLTDTTLSPWYKTKDLILLKTPEWTFSEKNLKHF